MTKKTKLEVGDYIISYKSGSPMSLSKVSRVLQTKVEASSGAIFEPDIGEDGQVRAKHRQSYSLWSHKIQTPTRLAELKDAIDCRDLIEDIKDSLAALDVSALKKIKQIIDSKPKTEGE